MKTLFLICHSIEDNNSGINKKIKSQLKSFNKILGKTVISYLEKDGENRYSKRMVDNEILEIYKSSFGIPKKIQWRFRFQNLSKYIINENIGIVVIRYTHFANPFFSAFLKKMKKKGIFVILEIPTYPYDKEYADSTFVTRFFKITEEYYRNFFRRYIDLMVTFSNEKQIFGVDTLKINNGIDIETIPLKSTTKQSLDFNIIAVASMHFWHGYDRVIEGMKHYYESSPKTKVYLHLVGNKDFGESLKYYELVKNYGLQDFVIFHGYKSGRELNELFNNADLALGCLGVHRKGIKHIKSLKNAEYCARGLPFAYSEIDDTFEKEFFIYKVTPDDSPVEIQTLLDFYNSRKFSPTEIRAFAENNLTWDNQITKIKSEYLLRKKEFAQ